MALESLLRVLWHFWRYVECFSEFSESTGMRLETFWKRSGDFFETSKKSIVNSEICRNCYSSLVYRHGGASDRPKIWGSAQNALKVFWGVFPPQKEPETYLQHVHTSKIKLSKAFWKFKKSPTILTPSYVWNDSQVTPSFYTAKWALKWIYTYF